MIRNWLFKSKEEKDKKERANKLMTEFKFLQIEHRLDAIEDKKPKEALIHVINGKLLFKPDDGEMHGFKLNINEVINKQKEQEMSENYSPKVGETVILKRDPALLYRDTTPKDGTEMEVVAYFYGVAVCAWMDDFSCHSDTFGTSSLLPLPLKSPKELAIEAMVVAWNNSGSSTPSFADSTYEAIAAGKIPGVVIDDGSELRTASVRINNLIKHIPGSGFGRAFVRFGIYINGELAKEDVIEGKITGEFCKTYPLTYKRGPIDISIIETDAEHTLSLSVAWSE